ncbi:MAG TPA: dihydrofolate reductase [Beijerinckiaceae bacterium]|nr:dihydrofolate reductase [Beijerinckiaceae bacterium]
MIRLGIVAALADNGVIGRDNKLVWRLKTDLRRFRDLTWGKPILMGRKTYESIGKPLPGRRTLVLTRDRSFSAPGVDVAHSWPDALAAGRRTAVQMGVSELMVVGGAEIYALALPEADRLHLTQVHAAPEGDALFPDFDRREWREVRREPREPGPDDEYRFTFVDLERRPPVASC